MTCLLTHCCWLILLWYKILPFGTEISPWRSECVGCLSSCCLRLCFTVLIDEMWCVGTSGVYSFTRLFSSTISYFYSCYCFSYFDLTSNSMFILSILYIYLLHYRSEEKYRKTIFKFKLLEKFKLLLIIFNFISNLRCSLNSEFSSLFCFYYSFQLNILLIN